MRHFLPKTGCQLPKGHSFHLQKYHPGAIEQEVRLVYYMKSDPMLKSSVKHLEFVFTFDTKQVAIYEEHFAKNGENDQSTMLKGKVKKKPASERYDYSSIINPKKEVKAEK